MTGALTVDASAAIALISREPGRDNVTGALRQSARQGERLLVPDVFWLELVNVLVRHRRHTTDEVVASLREADELGLETVPIDRALLLVAIDLAGRTGLSAYDATYLALAELEDARLLTLDRGLAAAAGPRAIPLPSLGPRRLAESPGRYPAEPVDWARFGPYLGKLRAEARGPTGRRSIRPNQ